MIDRLGGWQIRRTVLVAIQKHVTDDQNDACEIQEKYGNHGVVPGIGGTGSFRAITLDRPISQCDEGHDRVVV